MIALIRVQPEGSDNSSYHPLFYTPYGGALVKTIGAPTDMI